MLRCTKQILCCRCRKSRDLCVATIMNDLSQNKLHNQQVSAAWAFPGVFVFLWSTGFIGAKLGLPYAEPATFLLLRFALVLAILVPLCFISMAPWPSPRRVGHMVVAGALLQAGYLGGVFAAI